MHPEGDVSFSLTSYFLHKQRMLAVLDAEAKSRLQHALARTNVLPEDERHRFTIATYTGEAQGYIESDNAPPLETLLVRGDLRKAQPVTLETSFYFRGISKTVSDTRRGKRTYAEFHTKVINMMNAYATRMYAPSRYC